MGELHPLARLAAILALASLLSTLVSVAAIVFLAATTSIYSDASSHNTSQEIRTLLDYAYHGAVRIGIMALVLLLIAGLLALLVLLVEALAAG